MSGLITAEQPLVFHVKHSLLDAVDVSRETLDRLREYERLVIRWNRTINLISRVSEGDLWRRHFEDSLRLVALLPEGAETAVDMGSGAGFPGLVLAIASGIHVDLLEADHRKTAFLREVIAATGAPASVYPGRIEAATVAPADVLTARALAPLDDLLTLGSRFLKPDGTALFHKGKGFEAEVEEAEARWGMKLLRYGGRFDGEGVILQITGLCQIAGRSENGN